MKPVAALVCLAVALWAPQSLAQGKELPPLEIDCGNPFVNPYGPFDYRTATSEQKSIVETHHFTPTVETLRAGSTGSVGHDIDYTLRAFPNHPRALTAMLRLAMRDKVAMPRGAQWPVECYLERALAFVPDDMAVRQIRGVYNATQKRFDAAIRDLRMVVDKYPDNGSARYNLGLAYFEIRDYAHAQEEAKQAAALGFPLEGLKKKLQAAGKWTQ